MNMQRIESPLASIAVSAIIALGLCSCASEQRSVTPVIVDDDYEMQPARENMPHIMAGKLAHAQAILEGLALGDFRQIEVNAQQLVDISRQAEWMVHDTPSYFAMSDNFRAAAEAMVIDARANDLAALSRDYGALTGSCIACHRYLQAERPTLDMPGRVSMLGPHNPPPATQRLSTRW